MAIKLVLVGTKSILFKADSLSPFISSGQWLPGFILDISYINNISLSGYFHISDINQDLPSLTPYTTWPQYLTSVWPSLKVLPQIQEPPAFIKSPLSYNDFTTSQRISAWFSNCSSSPVMPLIAPPFSISLNFFIVPPVREQSIQS